MYKFQIVRTADTKLSHISGILTMIKTEGEGETKAERRIEQVART